MKLRNRLMNLSIKNKLVLLVYTSILLMYIFLTFVLIKITSDYTQVQLLDSRLMTVSQINISVANMQRTVSNLTDYFCSSPDVQSLLQNRQGKTIYEMPVPLRLAITQSNVVSLVFYMMDGQVRDFLVMDSSTGPVNQILSPLDRPLKHIYAGEVSYAWEFIDRRSSNYMTTDNSPKLCFWRIVKSVDTYKPIGSMVISVDSRSILKGYDLKTSEGSYLLMLNSAGYEILGTNSSESDQTINLSLYQLAVGPSGHFSFDWNGRPFDVVYEKVPDTDFYTFILYPRHPIYTSMGNLILYILVSLTVFILLLLPLLIFISKILTKPIILLTQSMRQFASGDFSSKVQFNYRDEIGVLGEVFNSMVQENHRLIENTYVLALREKEAELSAFQAQINPHFIYNLLNTIYWKAIRKGDDEMVDIIYSMSQLFRLTLNKGSNILSLSQELKLVDYYLKLQRTRYKSKLSYTINCSEEVSEVQLPKLILQPLVENSIIHGLENSIKPVQITLNASKIDDKLVLTVEDDAGGIDPDTLNLLPDRLPDSANDDSNRFALKNISERLRLIYQNNYTFKIESQLGKGTKITIILPIGDVIHDSTDDR